MYFKMDGNSLGLLSEFLVFPFSFDLSFSESAMSRDDSLLPIVLPICESSIFLSILRNVSQVIYVQ